MKEYLSSFPKHKRIVVASIAFIVVLIVIRALFSKDDPKEEKEIYYNSAVLPDNSHYTPRSLSGIQKKNARLAPASTKAQAMAEAIYAQRQDPLVAHFLGLSGGGFDVASKAAEKIFDRGYDEDINFIISTLSLERPGGFSEDEWQALQLRSIEYLVEERKTPATVEEELLSLIGSPESTDYVKRQVINNMHKMYEHSERPGHLENVLWQITEKQESNTAATALTSLARISHKTNNIDTERLQQRAVELSKSPQASVHTRVVAMEAANWLKVTETKTQAIDILNDGQQPELLKLAAIQTLVASSSAESMPLLEQLASSDSAGIRRAATHAITLINQGKDAHDGRGR